MHSALAVPVAEATAVVTLVEPFPVFCATNVEFWYVFTVTLYEWPLVSDVAECEPSMHGQRDPMIGIF